MNIGSLNKRIELQSQTRTADGMGGWTTVWATSATVFAAIWPTSANETVEANAPSMVVSHKIRIRYLSTLKASWRVKHGTKYYAIVAIINPSTGNRYLDIMAKEAAS